MAKMPHFTKRRAATSAMLAKHFLERLDKGILHDRTKGTTHNPHPITAPAALRTWERTITVHEEGQS